MDLHLGFGHLTNTNTAISLTPSFSAGFVIFYDLVLNLDQRVTACRLIVGLHGVSAQMGEPTLMPTVYTEPVTRGGPYASNNSNAIIGARQPVPK